MKVTDLREDGKISLSCKEIDQESGKDLNPERTQSMQQQSTQPSMKSHYDRRIIESIQSQNQKVGHGSITGILLDASESQKTGKKEIDPEALWLKTRIAAGGIKDIIDDPSMQDVDLDEVELIEEQPEIELNEKEAPFLYGQTSKSQISLQPL